MTRAAASLVPALLAIVLIGCAAGPGPSLVDPVASAEAGVVSSESVDGPATDPGSKAGGAATPAADSAEEASGPPPFTVVASATSPSVTARVEPDEAAAVVEEFANPTAVGSSLVFRAVDGGVADGEWIHVHLPIQPNGTTGWVRRADVALSNNPFRIEVDRASYSLRVFNQNSLWLETEVAIGNGDTPTPVGDFYLLELLAPPDPSGPYGPFAFGLSGFSEVLDSFGGADTAIIGLHGTNDPSSLGTDVSHGCIRIENSIIEQLAASVPLGTPVLIT
ncbi:MAG: L,D-transpeptidase [Acidimicrobiia bacterium]|nr:L,D-transpeptidase [Acidimicrobiia bacterium]